MRVLFLTLCIALGIAAGLVWSGHFSPGPVLTPNTTADSSNEVTGALQPPGISNGANNTAQALAQIETSITSPAPAAHNANIDPASQPPYSYHDGIMRVAPAVVSVYSSQTLASVGSVQNSQGSGVIVNANGIVLTNLHLVENFSVITVELNDGKSYLASLIGSDRETDLAVVKIDATNLPFVRLDEAPPLRVGDVVLAIGNPFSVGQTVTKGIVSATRRRIANGTIWQNFIQIDAAINPGNSGGALINPFGQLVGVNTAVFRGESGAVGIGFSIPADLLAQVVPQIIEHGSVSRGWLGLGVEDLNMFPALTSLSQYGAVITSVTEDGPAYLSGVKPMDVVVQLGEQNITSADQLLLAVSALPPGATVQLALLRRDDSGKPSQDSDTAPLTKVVYKVRLGERPTINHR